MGPRTIVILALVTTGCGGNATTTDATSGDDHDHSGGATHHHEEPVMNNDFTAVDHSASANFLGAVDGHFERGRSCAPGDFDGDGRIDLVIGNPGDTTHIMLNRSEGPGHFLWERGQTLSEGRLTWSIGVADVDGDGDPDIVAGNGGNEGHELNQLFVNDNGVFVEDTPPIIAGPLSATGMAFPAATSGVIFADFNNDGRIDIFLSNSILTSDPKRPWVRGTLNGQNQVLIANPDGGYNDVAAGRGLDEVAASANSVAFDLDNDGDMDIFENIIRGPNRLWENRFESIDNQDFHDVTDLYSGTPGLLPLSEPYNNSFSTAATDLNHDGLTDLVVWKRGPGTLAHPHTGHVTWIMVAGVGFVDLASVTGFNDNIDELETGNLGTMGAQVGDLNLDGIPDLWTGTGGPSSGSHNELWISTGLIDVLVPTIGTIQVPSYEDRRDLIDMPAPGTEEVPFPYRTHGACIADYDGDGRPDLAFVNGGPSAYPDMVREPNRLFSFVSKVPNHFVNVRAVGNGTSSNRDAIGAKLEIEVVMADGSTTTFRDTMYGGNGFSSQNGPELIVGLGQATEVLSSKLIWPDGEVQMLGITEMDQKLTVIQGG